MIGVAAVNSPRSNITQSTVRTIPTPSAVIKTNPLTKSTRKTKQNQRNRYANPNLHQNPHPNQQRKETTDPPVIHSPIIPEKPFFSQ
jgi:hypothetical protein